jgi:phosphatidate phosphatase APP1
VPDELEPFEPGGPDGQVRRRRRHSLLHRLRRRGARLRIAAYHGYGSDEAVYLKGRVLRDPGARPVNADDGVLRNLKNTVRRALTDEVPYARVRVRYAGVETEARANAGGFFGAVVRGPHPPGARPWRTAELEILEPEPGHPEEARATALVLVPPPDAEFGVISDIDDTVVRTEATQWLRMLRIVLLTSPHTRMPFQKVDELYHALQRGSDGQRQNPIFYLSSSPWNLFELLDEFFRVHGLPEGPLFLREWNASPLRMLRMDHQSHKITRIRHLLRLYPRLPWVLIGDSGQEDPEIYRDAVREFPGRIRAVYIRSVTTPARDRQVREIAAEVRDLGSDLRLVREKTDAAAHAAEHGWIAPDAYERMLVDEPPPEPDLLEKLVNPEAR